jgi:hypothetical protein
MGLCVQTVAATLDLMSRLHTSICKRGSIGSTSVSSVNPRPKVSEH